MKSVWGSGCIGPHFLYLGTSWRWVVSFTPRSLYPRGKSLRYPLDRRLGGLKSRSGRLGEEKIIVTLPGLELRPLGRPTHSQSLYRLRYLFLKIILIMDFNDFFIQFFSRLFYLHPRSLRKLRVTPVCRATPVENRCSRGMQQLRKEARVRTGNKTGSSPNLHHIFSRSVAQSPVAIRWQISALGILIGHRRDVRCFME
jgi:hypothetical protein